MAAKPHEIRLMQLERELQQGKFRRADIYARTHMKERLLGELFMPACRAYSVRGSASKAGLNDAPQRRTRGGVWPQDLQRALLYARARKIQARKTP